MRWNVDVQAPKPPETARGNRLPKGMRELVIEDLTLVTPMLGGGVTALTPDESLVLRGQSIRGQLRFWWRTFQRCTEVAELWEMEAQLWGNTKQASQVGVRVETVAKPITHIYTKNQENAIHPYAAFPLNNHKFCNEFNLKRSGRFKITITYPERLEHDIHSCAKLWILFGGVGARTRRGFGSIYSNNWPKWKDVNSLKDDLRNIIPSVDNLERPWTTLIGAQLLTENGDSERPLTSWYNLIRSYRTFRQHRSNKHTGVLDEHGKSDWPEPDILRSINNNESVQNFFFPRAAYGLPITFHFPEQHDNMEFIVTCIDCDGKHSDRWASPVVIKTVRINPELVINICLQMKSPLPNKLKITGEGKEIEVDGVTMLNNSRAVFSRPPLSGRDPYTALFHWMGGETRPIILGGA